MTVHKIRPRNFHTLQKNHILRMCSFESSLNNRISQGWSPAISEETGFSPHEITDFLQLEEEIEMELER